MNQDAFRPSIYRRFFRREARPSLFPLQPVHPVVETHQAPPHPTKRSQDQDREHERRRHRRSVPQAAVLGVLLSMALCAPARAQDLRLPAPFAPGPRCGLLVPCARSGPLGGHLAATLELDNFTTSSPTIAAQVALSLSLWHFAEVGAVLAWDERRGAGPVTLWGKISPLTALGTDRKDEGLSLALLGQLDSASPPLDASGTVYPDVETVSAVGEYAWRILAVRGAAGLQLADDQRYRGVQGGLGLSLQLPKGFQISAEVVGRAGGHDGQDPQSDYRAGLTVRVLDEGHDTAFSVQHRPGGQGLALLRYTYSLGPSYWVAPRPPDDGRYWLVETALWLSGYRDPIVGRDGFLYSDDGKVRLARFGVPHPYQPGQIIPDSGPGLVPVGEHVLIRAEDGAVRSMEGRWLGTSVSLDPKRALAQALRENREQAEHAAAIKRAQACPYCRPAPAPDYGDGQAGYAAGCMIVRWVGCGISPVDLDAQMAAGGLPAPGGILLGTRAAARRGQGAAGAVGSREPPSGESATRPPGPSPAAAAAAAAAHASQAGYSNLPPPRTVRPGKEVTRMQKREMAAENARRNGGLLRDDESGEVLIPPQQHTKGVRPPDNEAHIDHKDPKSLGGSNDYDNLQIISRRRNLEKGNRR